MKTKLPNNRRALIKDLELQIDFLVGYQPSGAHWKKEYHVRKQTIDEALNSENTPPEIIDKINRIQDTLYTLHQNEHHEQGYLRYTPQDYQIGTIKEEPVLPHEPILLNEWVGNKRISRYI